MKKRFLSLFMVLMFFAVPFAFFPETNMQVIADQDRTYNYSKNYSLTGNGANDIVAVAMAQKGKTESQLGYSEAWCADFVSDCAKLAGLSNIIPRHGYCGTLYNNIKKAGGIDVSSPQKGDIVFYYCTASSCPGSGKPWVHVGIMVNSNSSIEGNSGHKVSYKSPLTYTDCNGHTYGHSGKNSVTVKYLRPKYNNIKPILPGTIDNSYKQPVTVTANHRINTYNEYGTQESGHYIDSGDNCYIEAVYTNGFVKVQYPVSSGTRGAYAKRDDFNFPWYSGLTPENLGNEFDALILNKHHWKPLMIENSISENSNVVLGTENQSNMSREVWHFKRNSDGSYRIMPLHNWNLSLDTDVNTKRVLIWGNHDGANQKWFIYKYGARFVFRPACSDTMVLDLNGNHESDGTPIQIWEKNDSEAQIFDIWKFSSPGSSKLTATAGTASTNTKFSWTKSSDTDTYYLKIWKNKAWEGTAYKEIKTTDTNLNVTLPEGTYQAYIDSCNNYSYTCSNVVTINVGSCQHKLSDWTATKKPTCNNDGSKSRKCSLCGKTETATIAKTGHNYANTVVKPTCTDKGYTLHKCSYCKNEYKDTYVNATGHKFSDWTITKNPTCIEDGSKSRKCSLCGKTETATIAKTGVNTVKFDANGGSVSPTSKTVNYNSTYGSLPTPAPKTGYTFNGWYTEKTGGTKVSADTKVTITANQTLYAHWTAKSVSAKFFRNYNKNDSMNVTETFTYGVSNQKFGYKTDGTGRYSPMNPANVGFGAWGKDGYEMLGWSTDRNSTSATYSTYSGVGDWWIDKYSSVNLYAVWKECNYTVTFDADDGNVSPTSKTVTYDSTYGELPTPIRTGYTFNGWYTEKTGGTKVSADTKVTITANQTLYAQWNVTDEVGKAMTEKEAAGQTIPDGDYWIYSGLDRNYYLDIPGNEIVSNNANVEMWMSESGMPTKYDVWTVKYLNNGFYKITQYGTNICLDVVDISKLNNTNVQIYTENTTEAQQWSISKTETGYRIQSRCNSFYLDVEGAKVEKGTNVRVSKKNDDKYQSFCFIPYSSDERPIEDGVYGIQSAKNSEYYVDARGNTPDFKNGTNICIGDKMYDTFRVEYAGDGYYKIFEATTGLALEVSNPAENHFSDNQRNIQLYESNNSRGQLWKIRKTGDGHYFIISKLSGYYFDLLNGECVKGQNISQVYYVGGNAQKWNFVSPIIRGDANGDATVNISDAVMLQKWLLGSGNLTNWENVDLYKDDIINVFDMIEMRKLIAKK